MTDTTIPATLPVTDWRDGAEYWSFADDDATPNAVALTPQAPAQEALEALRAEVSRLTAERDAAREDARRLQAAGAPMANTMFNLAQFPGRTLTLAECALFKSMQVKWDAAMTQEGEGEQV